MAPNPPPPVIATVGMLVYPDPPAVTEIPVTAPLVIIATAVACVLLVAPPPTIETIGSVTYPLPPLSTLILVTDPETVTVAAAASPSYSQLIVPCCTIPLTCVGSVVREALPVSVALYLRKSPPPMSTLTLVKIE